MSLQDDCPLDSLQLQLASFLLEGGSFEQAALRLGWWPQSVHRSLSRGRAVLGVGSTGELLYEAVRWKWVPPQGAVEPQSPLELANVQIMELCVLGLSNQQIAWCLGTSVRAVKCQLESLSKKFGAYSRWHLMGISSSLIQSLGEEDSETSTLALLTTRERTIFRLRTLGKTLPEIGAVLGLSGRKVFKEWRRAEGVLEITHNELLWKAEQLGLLRCLIRRPTYLTETDVETAQLIYEGLSYCDIDRRLGINQISAFRRADRLVNRYDVANRSMLRAAIVASGPPEYRPPLLPCLRPSELKVAGLLALELAEGDVAVRMGITRRTARRYIDRAIRKTGAGSEQALVEMFHAARAEASQVKKKAPKPTIESLGPFGRRLYELYGR